MSVVIETTKGVFTVDLYVEQRPKGEATNDSNTIRLFFVCTTFA